MFRETLAVVALLICTSLSAQETSRTVIDTDTVAYRYTPIDQTAGDQRFGLRLNDYLTFSPNDSRKVKFTVIGAPAYSENTGWRLSAVATMQYRATSATMPHSLSLRAMASLKGCYSVSLDGANHFGAHQLTYGGFFGLVPTYIYGLDYASSLDNWRGEYTSQQYGIYVRYNYHINRYLTVGASADYLYDGVRRMDNRAAAITDGLVKHYSGVGVGINLRFSTCRTEDVNLTRGVYIQLEYVVRPRGLGGYDSTLHRMSATLDYYQPLWRGGLLALDLHGEHYSDATPWMLRPQLGGENRMRGYYYGRFNGNTLVTTQLELRQRVWEGLVVAGWGGCGTAFSKGDPASWDKVLPTYGAGLRWYFSPTSLVRVDYGMGKGCSAFVVGYSEAF